jgi:cyclopropane-fatty-acyl-phospholipid synthase
MAKPPHPVPISNKWSSLHAASVHKLDRVCDKLQLCSDDHLLEIGTGWGGLAIHAAQNYGCKVTTTTLSQEQFDMATANVKALGLENKVTIIMEDYRDLTGQYDKLVSIEMIEAVGHEFLPSYFKQCSDLLKKDGLMLIQAITIADQRYHAYRKSVDFIQKYIFPGGCLPSTEIISKHLSKHTDMQMVHLEDITKHYATTLKDWREAFFDNIDAVETKVIQKSLFACGNTIYAIAKVDFYNVPFKQGNTCLLNQITLSLII